MTRSTPATTIARIVRVNHAGEYAAIRIYGAQIAVARWLWPSLVEPLAELRRHEIRHCRLFAEAMPGRNSRPCRTMGSWSLGGSVLGFVTALLGPRMVWTCTEVVETNVHRHLDDQVFFLSGRDEALRGLIAGIREEEQGHIDLAQANKAGHSRLTRLAAPVFDASVDLVVWLSTWGDSAAMRRDLLAAREVGLV